MNELYSKALALATRAHEGQKRWDGRDYIIHPVAVADLQDDIMTKIVAVLHDTKEDQKWIWPEILLSMPSWVTEAVELVSKLDDEEYFDFIMRIAHSGNILAIKVKIADIMHNMSDLKKGSMRDKYAFALYVLTFELNKMVS